MQRRVLLMMDEDLAVAPLRRSLERDGFIVREAPDCERTLAGIAGDAADLLMVSAPRPSAVSEVVGPPAHDELLHFADVSMDLAAYRVTRGGREVHLGPTEFKLLRFLLQHPRKVFSRGDLLGAAWGNGASVDRRTIDVYIRRLRSALNGPGDTDIVRTVRSAGYALDDF